jgi:UDP-N-acetylmuramoylalanine--D-glutamate ligase
VNKALVLGLGVSGRGVARLLLSRGFEVYGVDDGPTKPLEIISSLLAEGLQYCCSLQEAPYRECDFAVVSPGLSPSARLYQEALKANLHLIGEAEYCLQGVDQPLIGITGTNGKTTTVKLIAHVLQQAGIKAKAVGNVGDSFGDYFVHPDPEDVLVAELSSYQIEALHAKVFDYGVFLNLTPDHLDRHRTMEGYFQAKWQLSKCLKESGHFFVQDEIVKSFSDVVSFATTISFCIGEKTFIWSNGSVRHEANLAEIIPQKLYGLPQHEKSNIMVAWMLLRQFGMTYDLFGKGVESFKRPLHRLEHVACIHGVDYFNDSKGTNVDAVIKAVKAMKGPVYLIAGGVDKGGSYQCWKEAFGEQVKKIFVLGEAADKIQKELSHDYAIQKVATLEEAVKKAAAIAPKASNVLLSPGCSSFDMFRDYIARGELFKQSVLLLKKRGEK